MGTEHDKTCEPDGLYTYLGAVFWDQRWVSHWRHGKEHGKELEKLRMHPGYRDGLTEAGTSQNLMVYNVPPP